MVSGAEAGLHDARVDVVLRCIDRDAGTGKRGRESLALECVAGFEVMPAVAEGSSELAGPPRVGVDYRNLHAVFVVRQIPCDVRAHRTCPDDGYFHDRLH